MACRLFALEKRPWVRPVGIGETLTRALCKLVFRAAGDQAKVASGKLQLSGIEACIEGTMHAVRRRREERGAAQGDRSKDTGRDELEQKAEKYRVEDKEDKGRVQISVEPAEIFLNLHLLPVNKNSLQVNLSCHLLT